MTFKLPEIPSISRQTFETSILIDENKLKTTDLAKLPGTILEWQFKDRAGKLFASQKAERFDTVPFLMAGLGTKLQQLQQKHRQLASDMQPKAEAVEKVETAMIDTLERINRYQKSIDQSPKATWVSVAAPETLFKHSSSPKAARQRYLPGLTNLHVQNVMDAKGNLISSINRSGALTDFSHNEVSLQELQDYPLLLQMKAHPELDDKQLIHRYALGEAGVVDQPKLDKLLEEIKQNTLRAYSGEIGELLVLDPIALDKIIKEREEMLSLMFLQDLSAHLKNRPAQGDRVLVGRSSLVGMNKPPRFRENDLIISERSQGLDMSALYGKMNGKTLLFDLDEEQGQQAYIDEEGQIHLPKQHYAQTPPPKDGVTLQTIFSNVSVQVAIANTGPQKAINDRALGQLRQLNALSPAEIKRQVDQLLDQMEQQLKQLEEYASWDTVAKWFKSPDPFPISLNFQKVIQLLGGYGSVNCYGGVDRTGYLVELKTNDALKNALMKAQGTLSNADKELLRKWGLEQLSDQGIALTIGHENKGHKAFKLVRFALDLYSPSTLHGAVLRMQHICRAIFVAIPGLEKQRVDRPDKFNYPQQQP